MLPEALSNRACSLVPGEDRLTVTVELEFDGANVRRTAFHRSIIRSDERLDYPRVDRIFAGAERALDPWAAPLAAARKVARALADAREARGALAVESCEPEFGFSREGHVETLLPSEQTESHRLIEFLMIAANEAVAKLLAARKLPALYRVHEPPDPPRVERLLAQLASLDVPTPPVGEHLTPQQAGAAVAEAAHARPRPRGVHVAAAALAQAGALLAAQPRPLRAALDALLPLHLADPPLPGPDLPPRAAVRDRRGRGHRARLGPRGRGRVVLVRASATRWRSSAPRTTSRARSCSSGGCSRTAWTRSSTGEVVGLIGAGAFVAFDGYEGMLAVRRLRGEWWQLNELETMLIGTDSGKRIRLGDAGPRAGREGRRAARARRPPAGRGLNPLELRACWRPNSSASAPTIRAARSCTSARGRRCSAACRCRG